ncbi:hypothetical protein EVU91_01360 [Macrococcoides bohemicum]|uniref:hypothetical protein n=1 Tax=Macrococcoides bohemicum TaxID=1903056 RepID=UPI001059E02A|nr:hypothetical protein [Macrococcus bohemicus]TDL40566.1 hypothetical protein EVU91_01360 [Macrococcus bohemicus]
MERWCVVVIEAQIGDYVKYKDDVLVIKKAYAHSFIGTSLNHKEDLVLGYNDITYLVEDDMYIEQKQRADELEKLYVSVKDAIVFECELVDGVPEIGLMHVRDEVGTNENNMKWWKEWNK